jgi:hypothetical protein
MRESSMGEAQIGADLGKTAASRGSLQRFTPVVRSRMLPGKFFAEIGIGINAPERWME